MSADPAIRVLPAGRSAVLLEVADGERAAALHAELLRRCAAGELPGVDGRNAGSGTAGPGAATPPEIVPAARTVLVTGLADPRSFAAAVTGWELPPVAAEPGAEVELPVRFDGPDLAEVAALWRATVPDVVRIVTGTPLRVAFCGFAPGFGYLTGLPPDRHVPRRATPRTGVPAGSVGLAGPYAGVYPRASPGGWQIVGTTDALLWDAAREPAALLAPGRAVRFTEVR